MPQERSIALAASIYVSVFCIAAVALLLQDAWVRWKNRSGGPPRKPLTSRAIPSWLTLTLVALLVVSLVYLQDHPLPRARRQPMPPPPLWVSIVPAVIIVGVILFGLRKSLRSSAAGPRKQRGWAVFFVVVVVFAACSAVIASRPGPMGAAVNRTMMYLAFSPLIFLILIVFLWLKSRDIATNRALVRARDGDVDGAIRDLLELIETRGPTGHRANALGALILETGDYGRALEWFGEAERLGYNGMVCRANRAVALRKMGRAAESAELLAGLVAEKPDDPTLAGLYSLSLAESGRPDEAREQLRRAQDLPQAAGQGRAHREGFEKLLDECRERLGKPTGWDGAREIGPGT